MPVNKHFYLDENGLGQYDTLIKQYIPHSSLPAVSGGTDLSLVTTGEKAEWQDKGNYVVRGTNTTSNTFGHWTGNIPIPELYNGLTITYICSRNTKEVSSCDLELTFPDGSTSGRIEVVFDDGVNVSTEYQRERCLTLTYIDADHTSWGDPAWIVIAPSVLQWYVDNTEDGNYPLLFSEYAGRVTLNTTNCGAYKDTTFWYNPSTQNLHAEKVNGYTLASACAKDVDTTVTSGSANLVTSGAVYTAIDNLPEPMVFKGTLGTGGTITTLPTASSSNEGYTYKVITAGTYASQSAKVGDVFVSNGSAWVLIPSGDTDSDTWRNIKVNGTELLGSAISTGAINFKSGTNTTVSGSGNDITISSTDTNTTYSLTQDASDGHKITLTPSSGTAQTVTIPDNNTTYTFANGTNGFTVTPSGGTAQTVTVTPSITNNVIGSGTSGYIAKFNGAHTITNAVALGSDTTKYLRNDGTWQVPTGTTYSQGTGISINGTTINHSNSVTAGTAGTSSATSGSTLAVPYVTYDAQGHVTASGTHTHTVTGFATTDTKNTAGSTDTSSKIFLIGATSQAANPQTYSDNEVYVTNGTLTAGNAQATVLGVVPSNGTSGGISLYAGTGYVDTYGIAFRTTANMGKHGYIQGDWATYFTMNNADNRGWIFRRVTTGNVASISTQGNAVFNGSVTVGGNSANTSGCRMEFNTTTQSMDFVFN